MSSAFYRKSPSDFDDFRAQDGTDDSSHSNLPKVREWISTIGIDTLYESKAPPAKFMTLMEAMVQEQPEKRPKASQVLDRMEAMRLDEHTPYNHIWTRADADCCTREWEKSRVAEQDEIFNAPQFTHFG
jgi:hypothetical protein